MPTPDSLSFETDVVPVVLKYFAQLLPAVDACAAVFGAMALANRTKPLSLILEGGSETGQTAVVQMFLPKDDRLKQWAYRCDKFTTQAFVSHAANIARGKQSDLDLLPRIKDKVMITKELAPLFRGRVEELEENLGSSSPSWTGKVNDRLCNARAARLYGPLRLQLARSYHTASQADPSNHGPAGNSAAVL